MTGGTRPVPKLGNRPPRACQRGRFQDRREHGTSLPRPSAAATGARYFPVLIRVHSRVMSFWVGWSRLVTVKSRCCVAAFG